MDNLLPLCARCGRPRQRDTTWCGPCHWTVLCEMEVRQSQPCGGLSSSPEFELSVPLGLPGSGRGRPARTWFGGRSQPLLEDQGPWQEWAVRCLEDQRWDEDEEYP